MKKPITLSIPKPCNEKWSSFAPTSKGGFCSSCQKEVIDFTTWNEDKIARYFRTTPATCGRFTKDQLKTYLPAQARRTRLEVFVSVFMLTVVSLFWSRPAVAQSREKQRAGTEQLVPERKVETGKTEPTGKAEPLVVKGRVSLADDGSFAPGVNVMRKGTNQGTVTDVDGRFNLTLANPGDDVLVFSFIGLVTQEVPVAGLVTDVKMASDLTSLGETFAIQAEPTRTIKVVAGLVGTTVSYRTPLPRRAWHAVKRLLNAVSNSFAAGEQSTNKNLCATPESDAPIESDTTLVTCSPNPVSNKLSVFLPRGSSESLISITSLQGQVLEERLSRKQEEQFDVADLAAGVYILNVTKDGRLQATRIVKR